VRPPLKPVSLAFSHSRFPRARPPPFFDSFPSLNPKGSARNPARFSPVSGLDWLVFFFLSPFFITFPCSLPPLALHQFPFVFSNLDRLPTVDRMVSLQHSPFILSSVSLSGAPAFFLLSLKPILSPAHSFCFLLLDIDFRYSCSSIFNLTGPPLLTTPTPPPFLHRSSRLCPDFWDTLVTAARSPHTLSFTPADICLVTKSFYDVFLFFSLLDALFSAFSFFFLLRFLLLILRQRCGDPFLAAQEVVFFPPASFTHLAWNFVCPSFLPFSLMLTPLNWPCPPTVIQPSQPVCLLSSNPTTPV